MHNIDRTNLESTYGEYMTGEFGYEAEGEHEFETYGEYQQESPFSEAEEMELAAELLSISNEAELDHFFGKLFKKAGALLKSPIGRTLGGALKNIAGQALPGLGAIGNVLLPGVGGAIGGQVASAAGKALGLELEGLSYEDQEFEAAKGVVRLAGAAANNAAAAAPTTPPQQVVQTALTEAAKQHAPGLLSSKSQQPNHKCRHRTSGKWIRRGNVIILSGD